VIAKIFFLFAMTVVPNDPIVFWFTVDIGGERPAYYITESQRNNSPSWADTEENPPLSARAAQSKGFLGIQRLKDLGLIKRDPVKIVEMAMRPIGNNKWLWVVTFEKEFQSGSGVESCAQVAVLMDGSILVPHEVDDILEMERNERSHDSKDNCQKQ
jgi:hypothetical protein